MKTLMISYDLGAPGQKYAGLIERIKSLGAWLHALESTWFVVTDKSPAQVRDEMLPIVDQSDSLIVLDVTGDSWGSWHNRATHDWLQSHLPALNPFFG